MRQNAGKWYGEVVLAFELVMVRWHEDEAQLSRQRRLFAMGDAQSNVRKRGQQEKWKETQPRERWHRQGGTGGVEGKPTTVGDDRQGSQGPGLLVVTTCIC